MLQEIVFKKCLFSCGWNYKNITNSDYSGRQ